MTSGLISLAQRLKCLPAMWENWVQSLGREDPVEKEMATDSSILAWRIPWMEEPGGLQSMGSQRVRHDFTFAFTLNNFIFFWVSATNLFSLKNEMTLVSVHKNHLKWL